MFTNRSVVTVVLLTIVTCGIYGLYWYWQTMKELYNAGGKSIGNLTPGIQFLLLFFYVGGIFFAINADDNINEIKMRMGIQPTENKIVYVICELFIPIVTIALVQGEMNNLNNMMQGGVSQQPPMY